MRLVEFRGSMELNRDLVVSVLRFLVHLGAQRDHLGPLAVVLALASLQRP